MQHRGLVCATLLFLVVALVLPAAPAAAEPGLVRVSDVFAGLWDLWSLWGDPATSADHGVRSTGGESRGGFDTDCLTEPPPGDGGDGDGSLSAELLDPDAPSTELGHGFDPDG